ncbi:DNA topology modulation protein [Vagococcus sp. DIV0080]|uniref:DNA topology modulation protein n=1 Tax=Candidatus Vagococcus giribetii TaxID=2230876 RepID=A0ABS3HSA3_9ENTE|nr:DNA topology modulation protein [Vagococcus sp. DIV0080]MBO0476641.1 DNA topology modulation protein [Vagococcus sp. DIV0080]
MEKLILIGSAGAGKSTLSKQLATLLSLDLYHLDKLFWQPNWVLSDKDKQINIQQEIFKQPSWIIDGNYGDTLDLRINEADTIIFLDLPRRVCIYRALKRVVTNYGKTRPDMGDGCPERFDFSFIKWIWHFKNKQRVAIIHTLSQIPPTKTVIRLTSKKEVEQFLLSLSEKNI